MLICHMTKNTYASSSVRSSSGSAGSFGRSPSSNVSPSKRSIDAVVKFQEVNKARKTQDLSELAALFGSFPTSSATASPLAAVPTPAVPNANARDINNKLMVKYAMYSLPQLFRHCEISEERTTELLLRDDLQDLTVRAVVNIFALNYHDHVSGRYISVVLICVYCRRPFVIY